ncbi:hypothetical protein TcasGA2_TC031682 [Tribolium castaneum]|uniref:Uncharacterized protein n=1 Tax=Tribolium castaneum TaxID=7070 RepID=A0A139W8N5_TRICA|nr:hypothetical protein TcasGA2_TC031682 [Tribolium castaneum]
MFFFTKASNRQNIASTKCKSSECGSQRVLYPISVKMRKRRLVEIGIKSFVLKARYSSLS